MSCWWLWTDVWCWRVGWELFDEDEACVWGSVFVSERSYTDIGLKQTKGTSVGWSGACEDPRLPGYRCVLLCRNDRHASCSLTCSVCFIYSLILQYFGCSETRTDLPPVFKGAGGGAHECPVGIQQDSQEINHKLSPSSRRIRPSPEPPSASRTLEHSPTVYTSEEREHLLCPGANKQPKNRSMQSSTSDPHSAAFLQTTAKSFTWGGHLPAYLSWHMHTEPWLPAKPPQDSTSSCHSLHLPSCSSSSSFSIRLFLGCDPTRHEELHYPSSLPTIHMGSSCPSSSAHNRRLVKANSFQSSTFSSICCCRSWKNLKNLLPSLQSDPESIFVVLFQLQRWLWRRYFIIFHFLSELWHFWTSWVKLKRVELMQTQQFQVICKLQLSSKPPGGSKSKTRHLFSTKIRLSVLNWQWFCFVLTIRSSQVFSSQNKKNNHQTRTFEFTDFWPSYSHKLLVVFLFHETGASEVSFYFESLYCSTWGLFLSLILLQWMLEVYHYFSDQELLDYW